MTRPTTDVASFAQNRRSSDQLNELARQHYEVCRNAADPFELAAQLESLGYNRYRVAREFGFRTTFDLAEKLYALTPRRPHLLTPQPKIGSPFWWHVVLLFAFTLTLLLLVTFALVPNNLLYGFILAWAVGGTYFMRHLDDADTKTKRRVFSVLVGVGLFGLLGLLFWFRSNLTEVTLALLWWQLPATFWLNHLSPRQRLRHFIPLVVVGFAFFIPPWASVLLLSLSSLLLFAPFLDYPRASTVRYVSEHFQMLLLPTLLGAAQSFLLIHVLRLSPHSVEGLLFTLLTVFAASYLGFFFKRSVAIALWGAKSSAEFQALVFRSLEFAFRVFIVALFIGLLVLFNLLLPLYSAAFWPFIALALALSLGFLLVDFNDVFLPATAFSIASLLILTGFPFLSVVIALTAILGLGVVLYMIKVERNGVDLL